MTLRQRIDQAAARAGFKSDRALGRACGMSGVWIGKVASGRFPGDETLSKIAEVTGVSPHWLREGLAHDAPEWARDYADPDIETMEQLRTALVVALPADERERFLPRHPSAAQFSRWLMRGRVVGWKGDETSAWRGWCRSLSHMEGPEIVQAIGLHRQFQADEYEADLRQRDAEIQGMKDDLATLARRLAAAEPEPVRQAAASRTGYRIGQTKAPVRGS